MAFTGQLRHSRTHRKNALDQRRKRGRTLVLVVGDRLERGIYSAPENIKGSLRLMGVPLGTPFEIHRDHMRNEDVLTLKMPIACPLNIDRDFYRVISDTAPWADIQK